MTLDSFTITIGTRWWVKPAVRASRWLLMAVFVVSPRAAEWLLIRLTDGIARGGTYIARQKAAR